MRASATLAIISAALAGGCALPPQPPGLLVVTAPPGAACMLARDGRTIAIAAPTPAIARGIEGGGVTITCERPGFATTTVPLATEPASGSFFAYSGAFPERVDIALAPAPPPP